MYQLKTLPRQCLIAAADVALVPLGTAAPVSVFFCLHRALTLSGGSGGHSFFFDPSNSPVTHTPSHCKKDTALAAIGNRPADLGSHKKVAEANVTSEEEGAVAEKELKNKKSLLVFTSFILLLISHLVFLFPVTYGEYVIAHLIELIAYTLILFCLIKVLKK